MERHNLPHSREQAEDIILAIYVEISKFETGPDSMEAYLQSLSDLYEESEAHELLVAAGEFVEPLDRVLGVNPTYPAANAFYRGGLIGLRIAQSVLGDNALAEFGKVKVDIVDLDFDNSDDKLDLHHKVGEGFVELGNLGYEQAEEYREFIEEIEDDVCPEVRMQPYMRRGFGVIMYQLDKILEKRQAEYEADLAALEITAREDMDDYDWDAAFQNFLEDN